MLTFRRTLSLWRARRARRAAVAALIPFVRDSRRRLGESLDARWRRPFQIGFLSMAITRIAVASQNGRLSSESLGLAQVEAWRELTGVPDDFIGEEIMLLSAEADPEFLRGVADAETFYAALNRHSAGARPEAAPSADRGLILNFGPASAPREGEEPTTLWREAFEYG